MSGNLKPSELINVLGKSGPTNLPPVPTLDGGILIRDVGTAPVDFIAARDTSFPLDYILDED